MSVDLSGKMRGLDLFSGIGGISLALEPWVRTVAYCERDKYAQAVLLSRMASGALDMAPIWDDVRTLDGPQFTGLVDIIFGGFPCQNISSAGRGEGLEGDRSSLFGEIVRLAQEIRPTFIFLENVPAIRTRGLPQVVRELAAIRYDCRWGALSAFDVGAPHKRERWFCLGKNTDAGGARRKASGDDQHGTGPTETWKTDYFGSTCPVVANSSSKRRQQVSRSTHADEGKHARRSSHDMHESSGDGERNRTGIVADPEFQPLWAIVGGLGEAEREVLTGGVVPRDASSVGCGCAEMATPHNTGLEGRDECGECPEELSSWKSGRSFPGAWESDAGILRVAHGVQFRVDRLRALGNSVVPIQVREAFKRLSGLRETNGESGR